MKLLWENIAPANHSGKIYAVTGLRDRILYHRCAIGVGVIDKCVIANSASQSGVRAALNPVPADMWRFDRCGKARTRSGKHGCARRIRRFRAAFEEPLHAHTDSQEMTARCDRIQYALPGTAVQRGATNKGSHARHAYFLR